MALNIPNVGSNADTLLKGIDTGSNMFARIMHPILEREKNKQLGEQFGITNKRLAEQFSQTKALEKLKMTQLENHFQQQFGLSKAEAGRAALAASDAHKLALQKQNPLFAAQQYEALENYYKSKGQNQGQKMAQPQTMPTQEMGQGQGMFSPQGLQGAQQDVQAQQAQQPANNSNLSGPDLALMKAYPPLRGFYKKTYGIDPLAAIPQTPEEKEQHAVNQATSIAEAKSNIKKMDEIEKTAQALLPYLGKVNTIGDILERKPDLAGRTTQLADMMGMTEDEDVGTFLSAAQALQAHMAKEMSSRGGYGVLKLVEQAKPNLGKSTSYNKGVIKDLRQGMKESFDQMKSEYERLSNGKKFPYNFEQYFKEQTGSSTGSSGNKKRLKFNPATGRLE